MKSRKGTRVLTKKGYEGYKKAYQSKKNTLAKHGQTMQSDMLTYNQWRQTYSVARNTLKAEVDAGNRKVIGNINQEIISSQAYDVTYKQARAIREAAKLTGQEHITYHQIRSGKFDWKIIEESYKGLRDNAKYSGKEAKEYIAYYFFGSV